MSTIIAGSESTAVSITRYARGLDNRGINLGYGYQVTWVANGGIQYLSFDSEENARSFYHLVYLSLEVA